MSGFTVYKNHVTFCKNYCCDNYQVAKAADNTYMTINSVAGTKYLGCGSYVAFPKGQMYCECCYSWKQLDMANRAWVAHYMGKLIEPFLVCEDCSKKMTIHFIDSYPLCGTFRISYIKSKSRCKRIVNGITNWLCKNKVVDYDPTYLWD